MENTNSNIVNYETQSPVSIDMDTASFAELVTESTKLKEKKPVMTLTAEYVELQKPGENFRGIFFGFQSMQVTDKATGELKEITAARFLVDKTVKINGGTVLVNEIKRAGIAAGTPVEVLYREKKGNTKIYTLTLLS